MLHKKVTGCECDICKNELVYMELALLLEFDKYRQQLIRLKTDAPQLYSLHAEFFSEAVRARDLQPLIYKRVKKIKTSLNDNTRGGSSADSDGDFYGDFDSDFDGDFGENSGDGEDDRAPTVQPARRDETKVGRNDPCPCGSGKKYKKCCGANALV